MIGVPVGCRDSEVLSLFATIINKLQGLMEADVPRIFEAVFEVTLTMITKNFEVRSPPPPLSLTMEETYIIRWV